MCVQAPVQVCAFACDLLYPHGQPWSSHTEDLAVTISWTEHPVVCAGDSAGLRVCLRPAVCGWPAPRQAVAQGAQSPHGCSLPQQVGWVFFCFLVSSVNAFVQLGQRCDASIDSVCHQGRCGGCTWNIVSGDAAATRHVACMSGVSCNTLSSRSATHTVLQPRGRSATGFRWPDLHMMTAFSLSTPKPPAGTHLCFTSIMTIRQHAQAAQLMAVFCCRKDGHFEMAHSEELPESSKPSLVGPSPAPGPAVREAAGSAAGSSQGSEAGLGQEPAVAVLGGEDPGHPAGDQV